MPVRIQENLPAYSQLTNENIFVISEQRALTQDIRPLKIAIMNIMPTKEVTETQLLRLLGNTPLQIDVTFLHPASHSAKNTSRQHLSSFYRTFDEIENEKFDGLIITGAPVEQLEFTDVTYWDELVLIMEWAKHNVFSTMYICWGAQAGLYYHYGIPKYQTDEKTSGIFLHETSKDKERLIRGFDEFFFAPHSRNTTVFSEDILKHSDLKILAQSEEAGVYLVMGKKGREVFVTGHAEYDAETLKLEYERDLAKGINPNIPKNYFPNDDPAREPIVNWRAHANLLFCNWLNYCVYQETPYDIEQISD